MDSTHGTPTNAHETHCPNGHEYTPENTYIMPNRSPRKKCRECVRIRDRARRLEKNPDTKPYHKGSYFDRLFDRIDASGICWEWQGSKNARGYGVMKFEGKNGYVHRRVWELLVGTIPDDLEPDHLCKNHSCCNPDHLELVTHRVNMDRAFIRTHFHDGRCSRGHSIENVIAVHGQRKCPICQRESKKQWAARRREEKRS